MHLDMPVLPDVSGGRNDHQIVCPWLDKESVAPLAPKHQLLIDTEVKPHLRQIKQEIVISLSATRFRWSCFTGLGSGSESARFISSQILMRGSTPSAVSLR